MTLSSFVNLLVLERNGTSATNAVFPVCVNTERGRMLKKVVPRALCMDGGRL